MRLVKRKLFKKIFFKSTILVFGSIALVKPVFSNPVEFTCTVSDSYGLKYRKTVNNKKGKKVYPIKSAKNVSENYEKFKVVIDINKGKGTINRSDLGNINGSEARIFSRIITTEDKGPRFEPIILISSRKDFDKTTTFSDITVTTRTANVDKRYLIFDKGISNSSRFTLLDTFENNISVIRANQDKKEFNNEKNLSQEAYYGYCKQPKN